MKSYFTIKHIVTGVVFFVFLHGCLGGISGWKGHTVREDNRIPLEDTADKVQGVWNTGDLSLKYDYLIREGRIKLDGEATLTDKITHFTKLDHLSIMVQFLDREGMALGHEILYLSASSSMIPMIKPSFNRSFVLPPGTVFMSFSYSGKVSDGSGDDGIDWNFWSTP